MGYFVLLILYLFYSNFNLKYNFIGLFSILVLINFIRLLPFGIPFTGSILILISSFMFWFSILILGFNFNLKYLILNFCPPILVPVLVLIEVVSNIARPVSLSVRIIANISCRHLLLFLCGNLILINFYVLNIFNYFSLIFSILGFIAILCGFTAFESGVIFIQAYVYFTLNNIYFSDLNL